MMRSALRFFSNSESFASFARVCDLRKSAEPVNRKGRKEIAQRAQRNASCGLWFGLTLPRVLTCASVGPQGGNA